jgi:rhamnulokinase
LTTVVAVDFGASSIRVCRVDLSASPLSIDVVHRYPHTPVADAAGHLRWDWSRLVSEMERGLTLAVEKGSVASIGIDTWGVDYGLIDIDGRLVAPPFSYRDRRTDGYRQVVDRVGEEALYAISGVQLQPFNTLFQVASHPPSEMDAAAHLLLLPELLVHHLTGQVTAERSSSGTTAMVDIRTGGWSAELAGAVGLNMQLLPEISPAGVAVGTWRGVPVHLVGGHDTASAVVAMGADPGPQAAFVSFGTWLLVGQERSSPDTSDGARGANFTNEVGALGGYRFLKNLAGTWLLDGCRSSWPEMPVEELVSAAATLSPGPVVDATDPRFLHPPQMLAEVTAAAGLPIDAPPPVVVRCIVDSWASGTASVLDWLGAIDEVFVFGGGSQSAFFRNRLGEVAGLPIRQGPVEATALGNAIVQGVGLGVFSGLADGRAKLPA